MKWDTSRQIKPVVLIDQKGSRRVLRTARDAAEVLMREWPVDDGDDFYNAVRTCLQVIIGEEEPEQLQKAIIEAAYEAGLHAVSVVQ